MGHKEEQAELAKFFVVIKYSGLTRQQKRTLKGQALAGDLKGAQKGFQRLTEAKRNEAKRQVM
jgi:hypothetical protein